ncbi:hypothetical protein GQ600_3046 [Phytophthora cactorum]|nr:hypothetical protein GQ600_3046 [Phytophthora cactorum]
MLLLKEPRELLHLATIRILESGHCCLSHAHNAKNTDHITSRVHDARAAAVCFVWCFLVNIPQNDMLPRMRVQQVVAYTFTVIEAHNARALEVDVVPIPNKADGTRREYRSPSIDHNRTKTAPPRSAHDRSQHCSGVKVLEIRRFDPHRLERRTHESKHVFVQGTRERADHKQRRQLGLRVHHRVTILLVLLPASLIDVFLAVDVFLVLCELGHDQLVSDFYELLSVLGRQDQVRERVDGEATAARHGDSPRRSQVRP